MDLTSFGGICLATDDPSGAEGEEIGRPVRSWSWRRWVGGESDSRHLCSVSEPSSGVELGVSCVRESAKGWRSQVRSNQTPRLFDPQCRTHPLSAILPPRLSVAHWQIERPFLATLLSFHPSSLLLAFYAHAVRSVQMPLVDLLGRDFHHLMTVGDL